jgi:3-deoxy-D-manno-oct-2-ulosonic acid (Kdo) hydroxylase
MTSASLTNDSPLAKTLDHEALNCFSVFSTQTGQTITPTQEDLNTPERVCAWLEDGGIIVFPKSPFRFSEDDLAFLRNQKQDSLATRKNVSYRPLSKSLRGVDKHASPTDLQRLTTCFEQYTTQTDTLFNTLLRPYQGHWRYDYASFRPIEEQGRKLRLRAQNDRLHVDSFTTRFMRGDRILRVFINLNPSVDRVWRTSHPFPQLVEKFKTDMWPYRSEEPFLNQCLSKIGLSPRPQYDRWMLDFHNFLKENNDFQAHAPAHEWRLPPGSAWMVYTDSNSHAVMSGQYAIEQTYIISKDAMVRPELTPINVLIATYK